MSKIETAKITETERQQLSVQCIQGVAKVVWPTLLKYMSRDKLQQLIDNPADLTDDTYSQLVESAFQDPGALTEISRKLDLYLVRTNTILAQYAIS